LQHKADINKTGTDGSTLLWNAVAKGHLKVVEVLLKHGADPNKVRANSGMFPLMIAAQRKFPQIVRMLLEYKADPNQQTPNQRTALYLAAFGG
jgi:ankyrin repeat protein